MSVPDNPSRMARGTEAVFATAITTFDELSLPPDADYDTALAVHLLDSLRASGREVIELPAGSINEHGWWVPETREQGFPSINVADCGPPDPRWTLSDAETLRRNGLAHIAAALAIIARRTP